MTKSLPKRPLVAPIATLAFMFAGLTPAFSPTGVAYAAPTIHLSRGTAAAGDVVKVRAGGFPPHQLAQMVARFNIKGVGPRAEVRATSTNASGTVLSSVTVPAGSIPATYPITVRNYHGQSATTHLQVLPLLTETVGAASTSTDVVAGHWVIIKGSGFQAGETVSLSDTFALYNGTTLTVAKNAIANAKGALPEIYFRVPYDAVAGKTTLTATGQTSKKVATGYVNVIYRPTLFPSKSAVRPGGVVTINGRGWVPNSTVHVSYGVTVNGTAQTITVNGQTDEKGSFFVNMNVPASAPLGTYTVTGVDATGNFQAATSFVAGVHPTLTLSTSTPTPGQVVTIRGVGYAPNVAITVKATFPLFGGGTKTVMTSTRTDGSGAFTTTIKTPTRAAAGATTVFVTSPHSTLKAQLTVRHLGVAVLVTPTSVLPGSQVTVSGKNFLPGSKVNLVAKFTLLNGSTKTLSTSATTGPKGGFATKISVPRAVRSGSYQITATGTASGRSASAQLLVGKVLASISTSPPSAMPGSQINVNGKGFLPNSAVTVSMTFNLVGGGSQTVTGLAKAGPHGNFTSRLMVPAGAAGGSYTVTAKTAVGRSAFTHLSVVTLAPSVVVAPTVALPGSKVTVTGLGFAPNQTIKLLLSGQQVGTAQTNASGRFSAQVTIPNNLATAGYTIVAVSTGGRKASATLSVKRQVSTHFYFASLYTGKGYQQYIDLLNPTSIPSQITITYEKTSGASVVKPVTVNPHSRSTENVNADLGYQMSASAVVAADVPIGASQQVFHGTGGATIPGVTGPATSWYFANGNTSKGYREFVAVQNPNSFPLTVNVRFMPTHSKAFTVHRQMLPRSRTTFKVSSFVHKDAVGVVVRAGSPIVASRSIFKKGSVTNKMGVTAPSYRWMFAAGPRQFKATDWIGLTNPSSHWSFVRIKAFDSFGGLLGKTKGWVHPYGRAGYLINKIAGQPDAAIIVSASTPVVAEQMTYAGRQHLASTDVFGVPTASKAWMFPAVNTTGGTQDYLDVYNPGTGAVPVVVAFMTSSGSTTQRSYAVGPNYHVRIDVGSVVPNEQLGLVVSSNYGIVTMNQAYFNAGRGAAASQGIAAS